MLNNKQYDPKWASKPYAGQTYAAAGCGPTAVSDLVETTPPTVGAYITSIGGAVSGQGTDWNSITTALKHFGLEAVQYNSSSLYGQSNTLAEKAWLAAMKSGHIGVLLMGPGVFTSGGHFIAIREVNGNNQINVYDPASAARDGWHKVGDWRGAVKVFYSAVPKGSGAYTFSPSTINYGDYNDSVYLCQELLKVLGYYTLKLDRSAGWGTLGAVQAYQKAVGLKADSICGPDTWGKLLKGIPNAKNTFTLQTIGEGSKGAEVLLLQEVLKARGIYSGALDAVWDKGLLLTKAVISFQNIAKLNPDGVCGPKTWAALIAI